MVGLHADATSAKKSHRLPEYRTCDLAYHEHTFRHTRSPRGDKRNAMRIRLREAGDYVKNVSCDVLLFSKFRYITTIMFFFLPERVSRTIVAEKKVKKVVVIFRFHNGRFSSRRRRARQKSNSSLKLLTERRRRYMCAPKK